MRNIILKSSAIFLLLFGLISLFMTISIIFDLFNLRKSEGNYVLFIVYANLICAIIYVCAGYGFFKEKNWTTIWLFVASCILIVAFIALLVFIFTGGIYEEKTIIAMTFRTFITLIFTGISWKYLSKKEVLIVDGDLK